MPSFKFDKWKRHQKEHELREKYGEHAELLIKNMRLPSDKKEKVTHSFQHLLNKKIVVPESPKPFVSAPPEKPQRSFRITDAQKIQMAMRNAAKLKTSLDD